MQDLKHKDHIPNRISPSERTGYILFAAALIIYGSIAWYNGEIYIPVRNIEGLRFTGTACGLVCSGLFVGAVTCLSFVANYYDKRNNEIYYERFAGVTRIVALTLIALGTVGSILYNSFLP